MRVSARPLIPKRVHRRRADHLPVGSLKERMTLAAAPAEREISTCPEGSWLDGLRASFDPGSGAAKKPGSEQNSGLLAGHLRSA
jgi:hypothetical protein